MGYRTAPGLERTLTKSISTGSLLSGSSYSAVMSEQRQRRMQKMASTANLEAETFLTRLNASHAAAAEKRRNAIFKAYEYTERAKDLIYGKDAHQNGPTTVQMLELRGLRPHTPLSVPPSVTGSRSNIQASTLSQTRKAPNLSSLMGVGGDRPMTPNEPSMIDYTLIYTTVVYYYSIKTSLFCFLTLEYFYFTPAKLRVPQTFGRQYHIELLYRPS